MMGVRVIVGLKVIVGVCEIVNVGVTVKVGVMVGVRDGVKVWLGVKVREGVKVTDGVKVIVGVFVMVGVPGGRVRGADDEDGVGRRVVDDGGVGEDRPGRDDRDHRVLGLEVGDPGRGEDAGDLDPGASPDRAGHGISVGGAVAAEDLEGRRDRESRRD